MIGMVGTQSRNSKDGDYIPLKTAQVLTSNQIKFYNRSLANQYIQPVSADAI